MKRCMLFFFLGASTTLLVGAGLSHWNLAPATNRYAVDTTCANWTLAPYENRYAIDTTCSNWTLAPYENRYAIDTTCSNWTVAPVENRYVVDVGESLGANTKKAMAVGFVYGVAIGKKKAEQAAKMEQSKRTQM